MMLADVSTPLNRATTLAPVMSAFSAGTALGPAIGGFLVDNVGLHPTFYAVGLSFLGVAAVNRVIMEETKPIPMQFPWQVEARSLDKSEESISSAVLSAVGQWAPLMENPKIRAVMVMNAIYWVALAGSQMTLLPLMLTDPNGLAMSATQGKFGRMQDRKNLFDPTELLACSIANLELLSSSFVLFPHNVQVGQAYMGMSLIQIFGNPLFAKMVDRIGKVPGIIGGCSCTATAMLGLTFCQDYTQLGVALAVWAVGSSMLSTAPVSFVTDEASDSERAQALALLRTCGDVGFLAGASCIGALSDWSGSLDVAMQASSGLLMTGTAWFTVRQIIGTRLQKP